MAFKSKNTLEQRFFAGIPQQPTADGCLEWQRSCHPRGYGFIYVGGYRNMGKAHRVAWEVYSQQEIPEGMVVRHKCDNPSCVNPCHLELGTQADNVRDRVLRGREGDRKGIKNGRSKLTEDQVREIRAKYADGIVQTKLAAAYNVSQYTISQIVNLKKWRHL